MIGFYFKFSGLIFSLKKKMTESRNWIKILFLACLIIALELGFAVVSLPMYLFVSSADIQEDFSRFETRRKISLTAFWGVALLFLVKILFVGIFSFYALGGQALLATSQNWTFDNPDNYTYDEEIEIVDGVARLKDLETPAPGETVNPGFDGDLAGWTFERWGDNIGQSGSYFPFGGNPNGYAQIRMRRNRNVEAGGYFEQEIVIEATDIYSTILNFDWMVSEYGGPADSLHLYAFVDDFSGDPAIGTEVWDSGDQTGLVDWTSIDSIDLGITEPGTYYLKVGLWLDYSNERESYRVGFDNIVLEWDGIITPIYADNRPAIQPVSSLSAPQAVSWDSFTETAVKNGGEIYYQLSDDDGASWQYWDGLTWSATATTSDYNTAEVVNGNIDSFPLETILWKAFLESDNTQQVILDDIDITYTENEPPAISNLSASQDELLVRINYNLQDAESDLVDIVAYEYSLIGDFSGEEAAMTIADDPEHSGINGLVTSPEGLPYVFVWDAFADLGETASTIYVRLQANDGISVSPYASTSLLVDYRPEPAPISTVGVAPPDIIPPDKPVLHSLESPTDSTLITISGSSEPNARIDLYNRGVFVSRLDSSADGDGNFSQVFEFSEGNYVLSVKAIDTVNNESEFSDSVNLVIELAIPEEIPVEAPEEEIPVEIPEEVPAEIVPLTPAEVEVAAPVVPIPTPVQPIEVVEAVEQPVGVPAPEINSINLAAANELISFVGTALPDQDIAVYVHSDQALVYNTRASRQGVWRIDHSQEAIELTPGEHSVFAIAFDPVEKTRSQASAISLFAVKKSFWVSLYNLLNLWTTVIALIVILAALVWVYKRR